MDGLQVLDLPQDVFIHLALFLRYNDLVALSASCSYLRSALNMDCVWRRLVSGDSGVLEKWPEGIEESRGTLDDDLTILPGLSLPPLCDQRLLCLRQAQLVNCVRQQRFEKQTVHFTGFLDSLETTRLVIDKPCTYNGNYLFGIGYDNENSHNEVVTLTNFGDSTITTENSFRVGHNLYGGYNVVVTCEVIGDKLVTRQDELFKVFQIEIPTFPHLHSINVHHGSSDCHISIVGSIIFSENDLNKQVRLWDVHSGQSLGELVSTKEGFYLTIIGHSTELKTVLFYSESRVNPGFGCILQYSTVSMAFTEFSIKIEPLNLFLISQVHGFISKKYNVIVIPRVDMYTVSVYVYDRKLSDLVCEKEFEDILSSTECEFFLIKDCLALKSLTSVKIFHLSNLEILWKLSFNNDPNLFTAYEVTFRAHSECRYLNIANAMHLIVISSQKCVSFWDFDLRKRLFELPAGCTEICVNDMCTKLIFKLPAKEELCVWSFVKV